MQRALADLGAAREVLLWNVVPTHPHHPGEPRSNRRPSAVEIAVGRRFLELLAEARTVVAVGRVAESVVGGPALRHPSHGGAKAFTDGLARLLA